MTLGPITLSLGTKIAEKLFVGNTNMTKKSLLFIGAAVAAGAVTAFRRKSTDIRHQADREVAHCERLLQRLGAQVINFR